MHKRLGGHVSCENEYASKTALRNWRSVNWRETAFRFDANADLYVNLLQNMIAARAGCIGFNAGAADR